jgi:hypothetical protein
MRQAKPFYRKQTGTFYVQIDGRQIDLGPDETEAYQRWHLLMAGVDSSVIESMNRAAKPETTPEPITVHKLVKCFLGWVASDKALKPTTKYWYRKHLESFVSTVNAELAAADMTQADVDRWAVQEADAGRM